MDEEWVVLARLGRSRGRIGEVYAISYLGEASQYASVRSVTLRGGGLGPAGETHQIESAWMHGDKLVLKFAGVDTISAAERLSGAEVCVRRAERPPPGEGEIYLMDLVGCRMDSPDGNLIGQIDGWQSSGEMKYLSVTTEQGHQFLVPFHRELLPEIDIENHRVVADLPDGLADLNRP